MTAHPINQAIHDASARGRLPAAIVHLETARLFVWSDSAGIYEEQGGAGDVSPAWQVRATWARRWRPAVREDLIREGLDHGPA